MLASNINGLNELQQQTSNGFELSFSRLFSPKDYLEADIMRFKKGNIPWNKGIKGVMPSGKNHPMYGKHHTEEIKRKLSEKNKGRKHTEEAKKKIREAGKGGNKTSFNKGHIPWTKGKKFPERSGERNHNWKGNKASYTAIHIWIRKHKPKIEFCEECNLQSPKEISNISGEYKRDVNDYLWLCVSCHRKKDGKGKTAYQKFIEKYRKQNDNKNN